MKKRIKILSSVLAIVCLICAVAIPASATSNGKWNTAYSLVNNNGSVASSDTYYIYSKAAWATKKVYVKKLTYNCNETKTIKQFYANTSFTVTIYKCQNNKYTKLNDYTQTVKVGGSFKMPRNATRTKYKVVISKNIPRKYAVSVKDSSYCLNYCISETK